MYINIRLSSLAPIRFLSDNAIRKSLSTVSWSWCKQLLVSRALLRWWKYSQHFSAVPALLRSFFASLGLLPSVCQFPCFPKCLPLPLSWSPWGREAPLSGSRWPGDHQRINTKSRSSFSFPQMDLPPHEPLFGGPRYAPILIIFATFCNFRAKGHQSNLS